MTALDPWQVRLGDSGLLLDSAAGYRVKSIEGTDRTVRPNDSDRANADGAVMGPDWAEAKTILLTMTIEGDDWDPDDCVAKYDALAADWNSIRGTEGAQGTADLRFRLPGRVTQRFVGGRPRRLGADFSTLALGWLEVVATYYAPDPRLLADEQRVLTLPYGDSADVLPNDGNHPAAVVWDVGGVVTDPGVIRNEAARFDLDGTVATTTFHRVRTDRKTVTRSSDSANMYSEFSGTWLEIPAGGGSFRSVGSGYGVAVVTATYRDTWL